MFLRLITDSVTRRPRRKLLTIAALSLGMAVVTAALSVSLDVGDRLSAEFRSLGANLVVTPQADSLPLEIGGVDYRPVNSGAYLPESGLPKIKSVFWHNNIIAFAPILELRGEALPAFKNWIEDVSLIGTWADHPVTLSDGASFSTGIAKTNPWWQIEGRWFTDEAKECVVGATFAKKNQIKIGDSISLATGAVTRIPSPHKVTGILTSGGPEDESIVVPLAEAQFLAHKPGLYRKLYVSALTKPENDFARRDPKTMTPDELERWSCSPYVSSIAYSIQQVLPGSDVRVIHRVADGEGQILTRVRSLLWLVTFAALLSAALAVGASSAASVIERRSELALMKALGAGSTTVGFLLAAEQLLLAFVGGGFGYALGLFLARIVGTKIFGVPPAPSLLVLALILALAVVVTLLGSALPLRRATRCEPAPILRGE
ncbi:MAG TPA: ABC transporter permease [Candidatus Sulfotelmatobacter sp.]|jgi:putative ABC transport system permease protein|nr:ABC transporter permease [Candidatus Sulfotelmatobacter sp.]